jgi:hypothetical protein
MASKHSAIPSALTFALVLSLTGLATAQTTTPAPAAKTAKKPAKAAPKPAAYVPPDAGVEQLQAADRVFYGAYECEFNQTLSIAMDSKYPGYVDVKHLKADYLMKPVVSSTGAIRLEDVQGETLMVQIANKSMLLNVKTGHRLVDDCINAKQRELMAAAQAAKAASGDAGATTSMFVAPSK